MGCWDLGDVGSLGYAMFRMWDVQDVGSLGYGIFGMWDVCQDVGC